MPTSLQKVRIYRFLNQHGVPYAQVVCLGGALEDDEVTVFSGPNSVDRAYEYASWKYDHIEPRVSTGANS